MIKLLDYICLYQIFYLFIFCYVFFADWRSTFCENDINYIVPFLSDVDRVVHETNTNVINVNGIEVFDEQQVHVECDEW